MDLNDAQRLVQEFHEHIGAEIAINPQLLPCDAEAAREEALAMLLLSMDMKQQASEKDDVLLKRVAMVLEELGEWLDAHAVADLTKAADAWADRAYVLLGDAVAAGLPAAELFAEVHRSNMTKKTAGEDDGKGQKGEGYSPPDIASVLSGEKTTIPTFAVLRTCYIEGRADSVDTICTVCYSKDFALATAEGVAKAYLQGMIDFGALEEDAARIEPIEDGGKVIGYAVWEGDWRDSIFIVQQVQDGEPGDPAAREQD